MTRNELIQALNSRDYEVMHKAFMLHRKDKAYDNFFNAGLQNKTALHINMLHSKVLCILKILDQNGYFEKVEIKLPPIGVIKTPQKPKKQEPKDNGTVSRPKVTKNPHVNYDDLSDNLKLLYDANVQMNGEIKSQHAIMVNSDDESVRADCRMKLEQLENQIHENWDIIDGRKELKKEEPLNPDDKDKLVKRIMAAQRYVQRFEGLNLNEKRANKLIEARKLLDENNVKANVRKRKVEEAIAE